MTRSKTISKVSSLLVLVAALLVSTTGVVASPAKQSGGGLFADTELRGGITPPDDPTVMRARFVTVNFDMLRQESRTAERLELNLFDDARFTAVLDRVESNPTGATTWMGHLEGHESSLVILVVNDGVMVGKISTLSEIYQVRYAGSRDLHMITEIDQSAFPREGDPIPVDARAGAQPATLGPAAPEAVVPFQSL